MKFPRAIAHRGASGYAPENTLVAFRQAKTLGAAMIEFDVQLTADGVAIVMHDATLDRTSNGEGPIGEKSWNELKGLDAGAWFHQSFAGEVIPTLEDVLLVAKDLSLMINVEIKPNKGVEKETLNEVLRLLQQHWDVQQPAPLLSSFSHVCMELLLSMNQPYPLAFLMHDWDARWVDQAKQFDFASVHISNAIATPEHVTAIKSAGYPLLVYTVNDKARADELYTMGVDCVFTDFYDRVTGA